ncbi:hypothetical protein N8631_00230 [Verrucomicrobiales bacterium]|nr:hypothetical protein [Verrucomicrobiales bacterium]
MRLFYILILSCFLVSCGNEYGIKKGTEVYVVLEGKGDLKGTMHKVTDEALIIVRADGKKFSIPKSKVRFVEEAK